MSYQAKGSELPASTLGIIEVGYFGRKIKIAGDRTFADWTISMLCDEDMAARSFFEAWSNGINEMEANVRESSAVQEAIGGNALVQVGYKVDMQIILYSKDGSPLRSYNMIGAWPVDVGTITVDWDTQNQIITFPIKFAYDYWIPTAGMEVNVRGGAVSQYADMVDAPQNSSAAGT
jgi:hypothetical protein